MSRQIYSSYRYGTFFEKKFFIVFQLEFPSYNFFVFGTKIGLFFSGVCNCASTVFSLLFNFSKTSSNIEHVKYVVNFLVNWLIFSRCELL